MYINHNIYDYWLYDFCISLHLFYLWWHLGAETVRLQFMALPRNWRFNSWFDKQIQHSCGVWQWQVLFSIVAALLEGILHVYAQLQLCYHSPWKITLKTITILYFSSMQRRLWRVWTFAQAHLSLRHSTEISLADSNSDLCTVYKNSEFCGEALQAIMAHLGNHQCVVSMRQKMLPVRCNKIHQKKR